SELEEKVWQMIEQCEMIFDVRTQQDFSEVNLDNAVNFHLSELDKHFKDVKKDQLFVLYCSSGNSSGLAYQYLQSQGF
ncbi:rhodanese-like domain-containing protein, partial [Vibrio parahaemolyticus]|uniref:rhodanese-like domain-containing protein n=1 Tax=Vibrio parahaemolyticus TaxID=670 RepID=UPI0021145C63